MLRESIIMSVQLGADPNKNLDPGIWHTPGLKKGNCCALVDVYTLMSAILVLSGINRISVKLNLNLTIWKLYII